MAEPNLYLVKSEDSSFSRLYPDFTWPHLFSPGKFVAGPIIDIDGKYKLSRRILSRQIHQLSSDIYFGSDTRILEKHQKHLIRGRLEIHMSGEVPNSDLENLANKLRSFNNEGLDNPANPHTTEVNQALEKVLGYLRPPEETD